MQNKSPTTDTELNDLLARLVDAAQSVLGDRMAGAYLQGSFALGGWDADSDVDFIVAVSEDVPGILLPALNDLHGRLYDLPTHWARHLEGSYFPVDLLRRPGKEPMPFLFLDNTFRELEHSTHDDTLVVRWVLRHRGIILSGPPPESLVDPVAPDDLRREAKAKMREWGKMIAENPDEITSRWHQAYLVLSYCRFLYTLLNAEVASKPEAAKWVRLMVDPRWLDLIDRAWADRPDPDTKARIPPDPANAQQTRRFVQYLLEKADSLFPDQGESIEAA